MTTVPQATSAFSDWEFETLDIEFEPASRSLWLSFKADGPPCFTMQTLSDMVQFRTRLKILFAQHDLTSPPADYIVLGSKKDGIFNLGGDLAMFAQSIRRGEREALHRYARKCIDVMYGMISAYDLPVITVAVINGQALGGGFEAALAQDYLIADESAVLGVPEIAFNTFPGMGAISLLTRRIGAAMTEQIVTSGASYDAREMLERQVIDVLAPAGTSRQAALDWMLKGGRPSIERRKAVTKTRRQCLPVALEELIAIVDVWTDCSCAVTPRDLRHMERLVAAQKRFAA